MAFTDFQGFHQISELSSKFFQNPEFISIKRYNINRQFLKTYTPGMAFGELALLYNAPRAATIKAKTACVLYALDRQTFNHIVKEAS